MLDFQTILGIETSCDETAAAVLHKETDRTKILSNIISSSASIQSKYGGVFPEQAAREQLKAIIPVIKEALTSAKTEPQDIDAIAVTFGPGLIGSLLIGVETAKILSTLWNKPLIPINHLMGHLYANWIKTDSSWIQPHFPCIGLLVSGGHTDLIYFKDHFNYEYLGGTRDDAAGECFDKCARLIGYPYPGGPKISQIGEEGNPKAFKLPRPMIDSQDFDFSFSGLKTAFLQIVEKEVMDENKLADLCASFEQAIVDSLMQKVDLAVKTYKTEHIIVAGGVAANKRLVTQLKARYCQTVSVPEPSLCTDNGAMIASAAFFAKETISPFSLQANPNLTL